MNTPNDMNKSNHTELPWHIVPDNWPTPKGLAIKNNTALKHICQLSFTIISKEEQAANAALIVHRVNNWDKLVEALEKIANLRDNAWRENASTHKDGNIWAENIAKQALKLAKEGI